MINIQRITSEYTGTYDPWISPSDQWVLQETVKYDTGPGCKFGCVYCNQSFVGRENEDDGVRRSGYILAQTQAGISLNTRIGIRNKTVAEIEPEKLVEEFFAWDYYHPEMSVILENFTDPSLDWNRTLYLMELLIRENHIGPLIFITKGEIDINIARRIASVRDNGGYPIGIITYTGLSTKIEPWGGRYAVSAMESLRRVRVPVLHSLQPIILGENDSEECISRVLSQTAKVADGIFFGGVYIHKILIDQLASAGIEIDPIYHDDVYPIGKKLPDNVKSRVRNVIERLVIQIPVHETANCAVASIMGSHYNRYRPNRTADWRGPDELLFESTFCSGCTINQRTTCQATMGDNLSPKLMIVEECLEQFGYTPSNGFNLQVQMSSTHPGLLLIVGGSLPIEELYMIEERCGLDVNNLPYNTDQGLKRRCREALAEMGLNFDEVHRDSILVGEEWVVYLDKNIGESNRRIAERWIRNKNRARIHVKLT